MVRTYRSACDVRDEQTTVLHARDKSGVAQRWLVIDTKATRTWNPTAHVPPLG